MSFELYINNTYRKVLLLSAASYFETVITDAIRNFIGELSQHNQALVSFVDNKAINRQYHTYFDWRNKNANHFFSLFGEDFKTSAKKQIQERNLSDAESAFMSIGNQRNMLVHQNLAEAQISDTFEEIYAKYEAACSFVELIVELLTNSSLPKQGN